MDPESMARVTRQNWRRVKRQKCVITNFFFFLDNYKLTEITVLPATISKSLRDFLPSKTVVVRKHIITSPGLAGKKGATGQINYKSYFAKIMAEHHTQRLKENLQVCQKIQFANVRMCEDTMAAGCIFIN